MAGDTRYKKKKKCMRHVNKIFGVSLTNEFIIKRKIKVRRQSIIRALNAGSK